MKQKKSLEIDYYIERWKCKNNKSIDYFQISLYTRYYKVNNRFAFHKNIQWPFYFQLKMWSKQSKIKKIQENFQFQVLTMNDQWKSLISIYINWCKMYVMQKEVTNSVEFSIILGSFSMFLYRWSFY